MAILTLDHICKSFPVADGTATTILQDVSFSLSRGDTAAVIGPSGSGKSTLLNIMGALDTPDRGTVSVNGRDIAMSDENERARIRSSDIGFIFQQHHLLPQCTVLENVLLPVLATAKQVSPAHHERAVTLLGRVGLSGHLNAFPATLSGGERQRTAVVRALINDPAIILADEPTGSLDQASALAVTDLIVALAHEHDRALVVVTHSHEVAGRMGTHYALHAGTLTAI
ncbi:MAG: ABC transporter ATP-binding protein [Spirochaetes bacterium]|nr:ABC transporter ATP-binding protein [Spirochaetota bacterium]